MEIFSWIAPLLTLLNITVPSASEVQKDNITCEDSCYRTFDGSCNNKYYPLWGTPFTEYARLFDINYADGLNEYPKSNLMGPREISLKTFPNIVSIDPKWTIITVSFGQSVVHDMALTAGVPQGAETVTCPCVNGTIMETPDADERCRPIIVPKWDPYHAPEGENCIDFIRTISNYEENKRKPAQQLNRVTAYLDASHIYGTSLEEANSLRTFKGGQLKTQERNGEIYPPQSESPCFNTTSTDTLCLLAGDSRVNQNLYLVLIHIIELRAHNRFAKELCEKYNPHWSDEKCYQEARRLLIAFIQHIIYNEYLPIILGKENMLKMKLIDGNNKGYSKDYKKTSNPAILNEHSTAAFRGLHSTIVGHLKLYTDDRKYQGDIRLSDYYGNPRILTEDKTFLKLIISLLTQQSNNMDRFHTSETTQFFFRYGLNGDDIPAIDINRNRDHGIASYKTAREACGLGPVKSFADLEKYIRKDYVKHLKKLYKKVDDVELYVAGEMETLMPGTLLGPTFHCIVSEQFKRTKISDRYFYTNGGSTQKYPFTPDQLNSIHEGATISALMCDNVNGLTQVQARGFEAISEDNPLIPCKDIPTINLKLWKEEKNSEQKSCK